MDTIFKFQYYLIVLIIIPKYYAFLTYISSELQIIIKIKGIGLNRIFSDEYVRTPQYNHFSPDEININGNISNIINGINLYLNKEVNTISLKWKNNSLGFSWMFQNCINITEIDLSHINGDDILKGNSIRYMFDNCFSLTSINFGNFFKGVRWSWMEGIFSNCFSLLSLDLSKMDTSYITNFDKIFFNCSSLTSLDLSNFNTWNVETMQSTFENCSSLKYIILKNSVKGNNNYFSYDNIFKGTPPDIIVCVNQKKNNSLYNIIPNNNSMIYLNECFEKFIPNTNYPHELNDICYKSIEREGILLTKNNITNNIDNICHICHNNYYPVNINNSNNGEYKYCYPRQDGYYFDNIELIFKKCYDSCKKCITKGDYINHKCLECYSDYSYQIPTNDYLNCYQNCSYPHYFDENQTFYCLQNDKCQGEYDKYIPLKEECVKNCTDDEKYQYEFRKICYEQCPEYIEPMTTIGFYCDVICNETNPFELIQEQKCVDFCSINDFKMNLCIKKYITEKPDSDTNIQDKILENIENDFINGNYNRTNINSGKDEIIEDEKMTITLTTTKNQKENKNKNITIIELGQCEELLRNNYKLTKDEILYIKRIDVFHEGMKIPKIEFDVYYELNGTKLEKMDLSLCSETKIDISIPITITENIDKLNSSSGYYNDICYPATSEKGTDITLTDRQNDFVTNNKTVCQENCVFANYDTDTKKVKCSCGYEKTSDLFSEININQTKLFDNFKDIKNMVNLNILVCYRVLFDKNSLSKNIGFFITIIIIVLHVVFIIMFYKDKNQLNIFEKKIEDIIFGIKHYNIIVMEEKIQKKKLKLYIKNKKKNKKGKIMQQEYLNMNNRHNNINTNNFYTIDNKKYIILPPVYLTYIKYISNNKSDKGEVVKFNSPPLRKKQINIYKKKKSSEINDSFSSEFNINSFRDIIRNKKEILEKIKSIMKYNETELNNLPYKLALKYDSRTYIQYYLSLIQLKNNLIFSFYYTNDYNSKIVKMDFFFFSFMISYFVNALFFNDKTIHKISEDEGSFNFVYQLPQIIYSSLISIVLNTLLKLLSLSENDIISFKKNKQKKNLDSKGKDLFNKIKNKFLSYFIISFILFLFFLYYLAMFCSIYRNTQIHLIKDTLISFGLNFLYPFFINLIPGIFRIIALKNKSEYLYTIGKIVQMI